MVIRCPYCRSEVVLKGLRPGEFTPSCGECQQKFDLIIPSDPSALPTIKPIEAIAPPEHHPTPTNLGVQSAGVDHPAASVRKDGQSGHQKSLAGRLGGYEIKKLLGRGTMGSVYLARQLSLGRLVALKTLHKTLAADPQLLVRFTREAYAAAQLQHPNIVQIYDFGVDRGVHFFSMEYIHGTSLMGMLREHGKLEPAKAAAYALQAARGLKFAHNYGLVHRDIKPDNLLLSDDGIIKIADLGLVRQVASRGRRPVPAGVHQESNPHVTSPYHAMGTPTYMPPEQARDSSSADGRADIYSLGCTLYTLIAGRPPFQEKTAQAMIDAHATQHAMPLELCVGGVSTELSSIVARMMARSPENRFQKMSEVIAALEAYLQLDSLDSAKMGERDMEIIQTAANRFTVSPWVQVRRAFITAFFLACGAGGTAALLVPRSPVNKSLSFAVVLTIALATTVAHLLIHGTAYRRPAFMQLRQIFLPNGPFDLLGFKFILPIAMFLLLLYAMNMLWPAVGLVALSIILAVGLHALIDRRAEVARAEATMQAEKVVQELRQRGTDESIIRQLVFSEAGPHGRGIFESLFGYDAATLSITAADGILGLPQQKWIDKLVEKANATLQQRWENQKRQLLAALEARWRMASGIKASEAKEAAIDAAEEFVYGASIVRRMAREAVEAATAAAMKKDGTGAPMDVDARVIPRDWANRPADLLIEFAAGDSPGPKPKKKIDYLGALEGYEKMSFWRRRFGSPVELIFGAGPRLILALAILSGFTSWCMINKGKAINNLMQGHAAIDQLKPLRVAMLSDSICDAESSFRALIAGLILCLSVFFAGRMYSTCVILGAATLLFGTMLYTGAQTLLIVSAAAGVLILIGILTRRTTE